MQSVSSFAKNMMSLEIKDNVASVLVGQSRGERPGKLACVWRVILVATVSILVTNPLQTTDGKEFSTRVVRTSNAGNVAIIPRLLNTAGELDIADVQIFAVKEAWDEKEADAELPPSEKLRWGEEPVVYANGKKLGSINCPAGE